MMNRSRLRYSIGIRQRFRTTGASWPPRAAASADAQETHLWARRGLTDLPARRHVVMSDRNDSLKLPL